MSAVIVVLVTVATMSWTAHERQRLSALERLLQEATAPLQAWVHSAALSLDRQVARWREVRSLWATVEVLGREAARVAELDHRLAELAAENQRLRALLDFAGTLEVDYIAAQVTGRNPDNWFHTLTVNRGQEHGVEVGDTVVTSQGLVGRVTAVTARTASVMLILDPDSGVGCMVQRTRDAGVVLGRAGDREFLHMKMFFRQADVVPGDKVVTSGLSQVFPKGLLIGTVVSVGPDETGLVKTARLSPAVDFDRLEEVLIVRHRREVSGE